MKNILNVNDYNVGEHMICEFRKGLLRIVFYEEQIDEQTRIIVYKDVDENNSKRKSYKQMIDLGENNYTQENYTKYCDWWGTFSRRTQRKQLPKSIQITKGAGQ